jgi:hypothetical protein
MIIDVEGYVSRMVLQIRNSTIVLLCRVVAAMLAVHCEVNSGRGPYHANRILWWVIKAITPAFIDLHC